MWILISRPPKPDAEYWPGRCLLGAIDAIAWPALWIAFITSVKLPTGIVGPVAITLLVLASIDRFRRAVWENERYWFTTYRWGIRLATLALIGALLKLLV